ncbi:uncharacterized protein LOC110271480 [Arachis ipaensis]|uniref:uncharacterized protein LOC110271480 n=1 Tax=Arachis ipaensis TaxID=130454 RepID=UPI000A2B96AA|nr:uncharacterized protein LOC110271480 [Arachis ipaensis]
MGGVQDEERARRDGGAWRGKSVGRGSFHFFTFSLNYSLPSLSLEDVTSSTVAAAAVAAAAADVARAPSIALIAFAPFIAVVVRALSTVLLSYELLPSPLSSLLLLSSPEVCHHLFSSPLVQVLGKKKERKRMGEENMLLSLRYCFTIDSLSDEISSFS